MAASAAPMARTNAIRTAKAKPFRTKAFLIFPPPSSGFPRCGFSLRTITWQSVLPFREKSFLLLLKLTFLKILSIEKTYQKTILTRCKKYILVIPGKIF
jgi:hypothetical protein